MKKICKRLFSPCASRPRPPLREGEDNLVKGRRGQRDGTDASGSAAALRAPRRRLAGPGGAGGPRGDAGTTFVSPGGSREVGGPKSKWPRAGRAGGRVRARGARRAGSVDPGGSPAPVRAPRSRPAGSARPASAPPGRKAGGGRPRPEPPERWKRGCRPGGGPARAGIGGGGRPVRCGPGRRVRPRGAASAERGTRDSGGRSGSVAGASAAQHAAQWGPGLTAPVIPVRLGGAQRGHLGGDGAAFLNRTHPPTPRFSKRGPGP